MRYRYKIKKFILWVCQKIFCRKSIKYYNIKSGEETKILVVRLDEIGDMIMTSPFLRELRRWQPNAEIILVVKPQVKELFENCPYIDKIEIFSGYRGTFASLRNLWRAYSFCYSRLTEKYDLAIVPRWDSDCGYGAGYISMFSRARRRVAYSSEVNQEKAITDDGFDNFYTDIIKNTNYIHEVERSLDILQYLGADIQNRDLEVWPGKIKYSFYNIQSKSPETIRLIIFLSCGMPKKEWDVRNYIAVIKRLSLKYKLEVILGGAGVRAVKYAKVFKEYYPATIDLVGKTTLLETICLLRTCDCYLGGDTGPMHLAAACGLLGVALFVGRHDINPNDLTPERFGPWKSRIITVQPEYMLPGCEHGCMKDFAHCINNIKVETVIERLETVLCAKDR